MHLEPSITSSWRELAEQLRSMGILVSTTIPPKETATSLPGPWRMMEMQMEDEIDEPLSVVYHKGQAMVLLADGSALLVEGCIS